ncbi:MAG: alpha-ketoacid dehydrogenase subunit beta, partial [Chloroflexi bacterium]|nr:alpha-ketoacid dehydrogenase subunit beta [Chloroflexota bacterium]
IVNHAAKLHYMFGGQMEVPLVIRTPAGYGQLAATHSQTFENYFTYIPGLKVVAPALPADAKGMLKTAIRDPNPVIFIEHSLLYGLRGDVPEGDGLVPFGQSVARRTGRDLTIVSYSHTLVLALEAAERLAQERIEAEVIDLRSLRPLDLGPVVSSVQKTNRALVVEEGWRTCGMGAEIASQIYEQAFDYLDAPVSRLAAQEVPVPYARDLERMVFPQVDDIIRAAKALVGLRSSADVRVQSAE